MIVKFRIPSSLLARIDKANGTDAGEYFRLMALMKQIAESD